CARAFLRKLRYPRQWSHIPAAPYKRISVSAAGPASSPFLSSRRQLLQHFLSWVQLLFHHGCSFSFSSLPDSLCIRPHTGSHALPVKFQDTVRNIVQEIPVVGDRDHDPCKGVQIILKDCQ